MRVCDNNYNSRMSLCTEMTEPTTSSATAEGPRDALSSKFGLCFTSYGSYYAGT